LPRLVALPHLGVGPGLRLLLGTLLISSRLIRLLLSRGTLSRRVIIRLPLHIDHCLTPALDLGLGSLNTCDSGLEDASDVGHQLALPLLGSLGVAAVLFLIAQATLLSGLLACFVA
jgi:hypothetical protein